MTRLTLTHRELYALWTHATHRERAPQYEIERQPNGILYVNRHDGATRQLTPPAFVTPPEPEGIDHAEP